MSKFDVVDNNIMHDFINPDDLKRLAEDSTPSLSGDNNDLLPPYIKEVLDGRMVNLEMPFKTQDQSLLFHDDGFGNVTGIASEGKIVVVYGLKKSRKSSLISGMLAGAFNPDISTTLGFRMDLDQSDAILNVDTEQDDDIWKARYHQLCSMCYPGKKQDIPYYFGPNIRPYTWQERLEIVDYLVRTTPKLKVIVIDGIADLCANINDSESAERAVTMLDKWAFTANAMVITAIHTNRQGADMNGLLGSYLEKKAHSAFHCLKDNASRITKVSNRLSRYKPAFDFSFAHNDKGYPELYKEVLF